MSAETGIQRGNWTVAPGPALAGTIQFNHGSTAAKSVFISSSVVLNCFVPA